MMGKIKVFYAALILILALYVFAVPALANAAEPPSVTIVVENPPADFSCVLLAGDARLPAKAKCIAWEWQYSFYYGALSSEIIYKLEVTANGETFVCEFPDRLERYSGVYTLDLKSRTLEKGYSPLRAVLLVSARVILTLLVEGIVFFAFGYRQKSSWLAFFKVNLATQGLLNLFLNGLRSGYLVIALVLCEILVYLAELIILPIAIKERSKPRTVFYVILANTASLLLGWILITYLPV